MSQEHSESSQVSPTDSAARSTNDTNVDIVKGYEWPSSDKSKNIGYLPPKFTGKAERWNIFEDKLNNYLIDLFNNEILDISTSKFSSKANRQIYAVLLQCIPDEFYDVISVIH